MHRVHIWPGSTDIWPGSTDLRCGVGRSRPPRWGSTRSRRAHRGAPDRWRPHRDHGPAPPGAGGSRETSRRVGRSGVARGPPRRCDKCPGIVPDRGYRGLANLDARQHLNLDMNAPSEGTTDDGLYPARAAWALAETIALLRRNRGARSGVSGGDAGAPDPVQPTRVSAITAINRRMLIEGRSSSRRCCVIDAPRPDRHGNAADRGVSPRRAGRCVVRRRHCRSGWRPPGRPGGSAACGRGTGTRRRRPARRPSRH